MGIIYTLRGGAETNVEVRLLIGHCAVVSFGSGVGCPCLTCVREIGSIARYFTSDPRKSIDGYFSAPNLLVFGSVTSGAFRPIYSATQTIPSWSGDICSQPESRCLKTPRRRYY